MKQYAKLVDAEQFKGDIQALAEFVGEGSRVFEEDGKVLLVTSTGQWNVMVGDYVVKEFDGIVVFKAPRFEKDYSEVTVEESAIVVTDEFAQKIIEGPGTSAVSEIQEEAPAPKRKSKKDEE